MEFSLIVCTYMRPDPIKKLLESIKEQSLYPNEIIIIDGSFNEETRILLEKERYKNVQYFKVGDEDRGLTKQRNYGIAKVKNTTEVVCFLDDDIVLEQDYFNHLIGTYKKHPDASGVGGYIINAMKWKKVNNVSALKYDDFYFDGWVKKLTQRYKLRKKFGLLPDTPPCHMPESGNGFPVSSLPPSDKIYSVEYFLGGVSSFTKSVLEENKFSTYFEGYGLYEDMEFCIRVSKKHQLYVNTQAKLYHYHDSSGRPNKFNYGKMVIKNGWFVWKSKYKKPTAKSLTKWIITSILLTLIKFSNIFSHKNKRQSLTEFLGRVYGLLSLIFSKPNPEKYVYNN